MSDEISEVIAAERLLLEPEVRTDREAVDRMLAPDFTEVGASGVRWDREQMLEAISGFSSSAERVDASDFSGRVVGDGLVLLSYSTPGALRTSLWRRGTDGWQVIFHQGTPTAARS